LDQVVFSPFFCNFVIFDFFLALENRFHPTRLSEMFCPSFFLNRLFPVQVAAWCAWKPGVLLFYFMPLLPQFPDTAFLLCFWVLVTLSATKVLEICVQMNTILCMKPFEQTHVHASNSSSSEASPHRLSDLQERILAFLQEHREREGLPPSTREIQRHFGFRSQTSVMNHLRTLEKRGLLQRRRGTARGWIPTHNANSQLQQDLRTVPIFGIIPAGPPSEQFQLADEIITLDAATLELPRGDRIFGLRVRGDSMIGAHILPGDIVILEFRPPKHGDIVAALIDGESTLKRYIVKNGRTYLRAENPNYPDLIPTRELVIQGVMRCLLRKT
jgi:repressor LexA